MSVPGGETNSPSDGDSRYPAGSPAQAIAAQAHYGQVGVVPWTFAQTLLGTAATLVPWLLLLLLSNALSSGGTLQAPLTPAVDAASAVITFLFTAVVEAAFLLAPAYFVLLRRAPGVSRGEALRALGFRRSSWGRALVGILGGFVAILVVSYLYEALIQQFHLPLQTNSDVLLNEARYAPITTIALLVGAVLVAPFCEEVFFRGFLFAGMLRGMPVWGAVVLSALLFGIAHGDVGSFAVLVVIGLILAVLRWRLGSIWPGMLLHAANNATAAVVIVLALTGH